MHLEHDVKWSGSSSINIARLKTSKFKEKTLDFFFKNVYQPAGMEPTTSSQARVNLRENKNLLPLVKLDFTAEMWEMWI